MPNLRTPIGNITGGDPTGTFTRPVRTLEQAQITDGAQNAWPLDEFPKQPVAKDWTGGEDGRHNSSATGRKWSDFQALSFTGDHQYTVLPYDNFDVSNQTYECMIGEVTAAGTVFSRRNFFELDVVDNTTVRLYMKGETDLDMSVNVMDGDPHLIAVVITPTTYNFYVDGMSAGALTFVGSVPGPGTGIYLGREEVDGTTLFRGVISQFAFFPAAVSAADILTHYYYGICATTEYSRYYFPDYGFESAAFGNGWTMNNAGAGFYMSYGGGAYLPKEGTYMLSGTNVDGDAYEVNCDYIDLVNTLGYTAEEIDEGFVWIKFEYWILTASTDYGKVRLRFGDAADVTIRTTDYSANRQPDSWTKYSTAEYQVQPGERKVKIYLYGFNVVGEYKGIMFDDIGFYHKRVCP